MNFGFAQCQVGRVTPCAPPQVWIGPRRASSAAPGRLSVLVGILALASGAVSSPAQWSEVASGLAYREFTQPGPVRVFVVRADRATNTWTIDSMTSLGEIKGGHETVPGMAARYDDSITFDGHRYAVKAAINGDYHDAYDRSGYALSGQIMNGWFALRYTEYSGTSGFVWTSDRRCFLGGNVQNGRPWQRVIFADGAEMKIDQFNDYKPRRADALALYTWQFGAHTGATNEGVEVLVRMTSPAGLFPPAPGVKGQIVKVRDPGQASPLLFNHVALSAGGRAAAELRRHARPGESLHLSFELRDHGNPQIGLPAADWRHAYAGVGAPKYIVVNGQVPRDWEVKAAKLAAEGKKYGAVIKDPRTGIAFNDRYVYFFVADGRSSNSIGMTFTDAGFFCKDVLQATFATLQDGGGSSTLWVNGQVKNTPSGKGKDEKYGVLRAVANGLFIAEVLPPKRSAAFQTGQKVRLPDGGELRLGPGTTFGPAGPAPAGQAGVILAEPLNGIFAKGDYWWFCRFGETEGWAALARLTAAQ
jgi:hypothetical protein